MSPKNVKKAIIKFLAEFNYSAGKLLRSVLSPTTVPTPTEMAECGHYSSERRRPASEALTFTIINPVV